MQAFVHDSLPTRLHVELTNRCNSACATCVRTAAPQPDSDMPLGWLTELVAALPSLRSIALQVNGEPLLYPHLAAALGLLRDRGVVVELNTNGLALRGRRAHLLLASVARLNVSLDAGSAPTYQLMRGVDAWQRVIAHVDRFVKMRRGVHGAPRVALWVTATRLNLVELPDIVRLAARLGVDEVYVQRLVYFGRGVARAVFSVHGRLSPEEHAALDEAEGLAQELGIALTAAGGYSPRRMLDGGNDTRSQCTRPLASAVVLANGDVVPCCICTFTGAPHEIVMGNLRDSSWPEIWSGARYARFRQELWGGRGPSCCSGCGTRWSL